MRGRQHFPKTNRTHKRKVRYLFACSGRLLDLAGLVQQRGGAGFAVLGQWVGDRPPPELNAAAGSESMALQLVATDEFIQDWRWR
jgi:hypothetical protein